MDLFIDGKLVANRSFRYQLNETRNDLHSEFTLRFWYKSIFVEATQSQWINYMFFTYFQLKYPLFTVHILMFAHASRAAWIMISPWLLVMFPIVWIWSMEISFTVSNYLIAQNHTHTYTHKQYVFFDGQRDATMPRKLIKIVSIRCQNGLIKVNSILISHFIHLHWNISHVFDKSIATSSSFICIRWTIEAHINM